MGGATYYSARWESPKARCGKAVDDVLDAVGPDIDYLEVVDYFSIADDLDYVGEAADRAFGWNDVLVRNRRSDHSRNGSSHLLVDAIPL